MKKKKTATTEGQTQVTESDFIWEKFIVHTYPSVPEGISYVLYQDRSAYSQVFNGRTSAQVDALTTMALRNTNPSSSAPFPYINASSYIPAHMLSPIFSFNVATGLTMDYTIGDGVNTSTGTAEAGW